MFDLLRSALLIAAGVLSVASGTLACHNARNQAIVAGDWLRADDELERQHVATNCDHPQPDVIARLLVRLQSHQVLFYVHGRDLWQASRFRVDIRDGDRLLRQFAYPGDLTRSRTSEGNGVAAYVTSTGVYSQVMADLMAGSTVEYRVEFSDRREQYSVSLVGARRTLMDGVVVASERPRLPTPQSAQRQAAERERLAASSRGCDWDLRWQQHADFRQCANAADATSRTLTNLCREAARRQADYYNRSGRPRDAVDADLREEGCTFKFVDKHRACIAFCQLEFGGQYRGEK